MVASSAEENSFREKINMRGLLIEEEMGGN